MGACTESSRDACRSPVAIVESRSAMALSRSGVSRRGGGAVNNETRFAIDVRSGRLDEDRSTGTVEPSSCVNEALMNGEGREIAEDEDLTRYGLVLRTTTGLGHLRLQCPTCRLGRVQEDDREHGGAGIV